MLRVSVFLYLLFASFSTIVFYLPLYLQHRGLTSGQIGAVLAAGGLVAVFAGPFWSYISDKRKTVKGVLLPLLAFALLVGTGLMSSGTFLLVLLIYVLYTFFHGAVPPLVETLTLSFAQENKKDYGRLRVWGEIGIGSAALIVGLVIERIGIGNLWIAFVFTASLALAAGLWLRDAAPASAPVDLASLGRAVAQPRFIRFLLLTLLIATPHRMNDSMLGIYLAELGGTESQVGAAWILATFSTIPALVIVGKAIKRWNELAVFAAGAVVYTLRWAICSMADGPLVLIGTQLLHSLTFPLFFVSSVHYLYAISPPHLRATGQAAFAVTFGLGGVIGTAGGGALIERFGGQAAYGAGAALAFAGALFAAAAYAAYRKKGSAASSPVSSESSRHTV